MNFQVVPDDERHTRPGRRAGPLMSALIEGQTVFVPGLKWTAGLRATAESHNFRFRQRKGNRNGEDGMYVWLEVKTND